MDKEFLQKIIGILKKNSYKYSLEAYINQGLYYVNGIFVYNCEDKKELKRQLDSVRDNLKIRESYAWYLGDRKKAVLIKLKELIELAIGEFEVVQTDNYVNAG